MSKKPTISESHRLQLINMLESSEIEFDINPDVEGGTTIYILDTEVSFVFFSDDTLREIF